MVIIVMMGLELQQCTHFDKYPSTSVEGVQDLSIRVCHPGDP